MDEDKVKAAFDAAKSSVDEAVGPWVQLSVIMLQMRQALTDAGASEPLASYMAAVYTATGVTQASAESDRDK